MNKPIVLVLIVAAIGGFFVIGSPIEKSDTPQTITKKYEENKRLEIAQETGGQIIKAVGTQAVDSSCKGPNTSFCSTTTFVVSVIGVAVAILVIAGIVSGIIVIIRVISSIIDQLT